MEKILILVMVSEDGESYLTGKDLDKMKKRFNEAVDTGFFLIVFLALVEEDQEFGFGVYGDFFGGEVLKEFKYVKEF